MNVISINNIDKEEGVSGSIENENDEKNNTKQLNYDL